MVNEIKEVDNNKITPQVANNKYKLLDEAFISHLVVNWNVTSSTQNQALAAILFLYKNALKSDIG